MVPGAYPARNEKIQRVRRIEVRSVEGGVCGGGFRVQCSGFRVLTPRLGTCVLRELCCRSPSRVEVSFKGCVLVAVLLCPKDATHESET